jgi:hypothetical protein
MLAVVRTARAALASLADGSPGEPRFGRDGELPVVAIFPRNAIAIPDRIERRLL